MKRFIEGVDRGQGTLFPERLEDWIAEDNPVRVIDVFVDELDLGGLGFDAIDLRPSLIYGEVEVHYLFVKSYRGIKVTVVKECYGEFDSASRGRNQTSSHEDPPERPLPIEQMFRRCHGGQSSLVQRRIDPLNRHLDLATIPGSPGAFQQLAKILHTVENGRIGLPWRCGHVGDAMPAMRRIPDLVRSGAEGRPMTLLGLWAIR